MTSKKTNAAWDDDDQETRRKTTNLFKEFNQRDRPQNKFNKQVEDEQLQKRQEEREALEQAPAAPNKSAKRKTTKDTATARKKPARPAPAKDPNITGVEDDLRRRLGTKVFVKPQGDGKRGRIEIEYYSNDDLDRLISLLRKG